MSSMAKVFVVVNLVLVVAVFGSAATGLGAQNDYRVELVKTVKNAAATEEAQSAKIVNLELKASTQGQKAAQQSARADDAELRLLQAGKNLEGARQMNAQLTSSHEGFAGQLTALNVQIEKQQSTVSAAQSEAKDSNQKYQDAKKQWEEEVRNRSALEGRVQELDDTVRSLQAASNDKDKEIRNLKLFVSKAKEILGDDLGIVGAIGADGVVLKVQEVAGGGIVVVISVGRDDKVSVGDQYKLSRGNKFVGFIKIVRVQKDKAVGEFDTENTGAGAPPQAQDRAYVR